MLGFFFRHYDPWVDRYIVFDDGSTDGSLEILKAHPKVELRRFKRTNSESFVLSHQQFHNHIWKESRGRADWVVITAVDEHLFVRSTEMRAYLESCDNAGVSLAPALGFQMISDTFPEPDEHLAFTRTLGAPWRKMNKLGLFKPDALMETNFATGRHSADPRGALRFPDQDEVLLLHYKYLNFERTLSRHGEQKQGLGRLDFQNRLGVQYSWSAGDFRAVWEAFEARAIDLSAPDFTTAATKSISARWWRGGDFHDAGI